MFWARLLIGVAALVGFVAPATANAAPSQASDDSEESDASDPFCADPALTVVMGEGEVLQIGFTDLSPDDRINEVKVQVAPEDQSIPGPAEGVIWQARSGGRSGISPVVIKVPVAPAGMTVPVPFDDQLPDNVIVTVALLRTGGEPLNLTEIVDVAQLRGQPPGTAEVDVGCDDSPGSELGSIMKSLGIGAVLFILGVSALLLVLNLLLLGVRRVIFGSTR